MHAHINLLTLKNVYMYVLAMMFCFEFDPSFY